MGNESITHGTLSVVARVKLSKIPSLLGYLVAINKNIEAYPELPFGEVDGLHFARCTVVPSLEDTEVSWLIFSTNFDGTLDTHLKTLIKRGAVGLKKLFGHCVGFSGNIEEFVYQYKVAVPAFYDGKQGISLPMIRRQQTLYKELQNIINNNDNHIRTLSGKGVHKFLYGKIVANTEFSWALKPPSPRTSFAAKWRGVKNFLFKKPFLLWSIISIIMLFTTLICTIAKYIIGITSIDWFQDLYLVTSVISIPWIALLLLLIIRLRWDEATSQTISSRVYQADASRLEKDENRIVQNALTSVTVMKLPPFRVFLLNQLFALISLLSSLSFYKGYLAAIPSIHFAKWFYIENNRRLIFFSNFDGSWENYLSDFVDKGSVGLTAVWSNTFKFPRTFLFFFRGARYETAFKVYARNSNLPTNVWYSAYKELSNPEIQTNYDLHQGLATPDLNGKSLEKWLLQL